MPPSKKETNVGLRCRWGIGFEEIYSLGQVNLPIQELPASGLLISQRWPKGLVGMLSAALWLAIKEVKLPKVKGRGVRAFTRMPTSQNRDMGHPILWLI